MKLADLSAETLAKFAYWRFDRIREKHEGPQWWEFHPTDDNGWPGEFFEVEGYQVLFPEYDVSEENWAKITIDRIFLSEDGQLLTIFFRDYSYRDWYNQTPQDNGERWEAGRLVIAHRVPGEDFFVTILFHERFLTEGPIDYPGITT